MAELQSPSDVLSDSPAALIRGMDGLIAFWSPAMEHRYGFAAEEAVGQVSHQLLRTSSWQEIGEIEAVLVDRNVWHGGLIHRRADGQPVMAANHWHLHRRTNDQEMLVTELHSDIVADRHRRWPPTCGRYDDYSPGVEPAADGAGQLHQWRAARARTGLVRQAASGTGHDGGSRTAYSD